jgi:hypothetical protein
VRVKARIEAAPTKAAIITSGVALFIKFAQDTTAMEKGEAGGVS